MGLIEWAKRIGRKPATSEERVKSLGDRLAEGNQPFPWGLVSQDEKAAIDRQIRGVLSVTSGCVMLNPWQCLNDERATQLVEQAQGIGRATSGLSDFDPKLWEP